MNVSDDLLISLFPYDEVSAFLLLVKARNSSLLTVKPNLSFLKCLLLLCYVMLCYVMLCYVMLCYVMLCYVML